MIILDTCVVSEVAKARPDPAVVHWFDQSPDEDLYLSVLTLGEIEKGAAMLEEAERRERVLEWLTTIQGKFGDRILPIDTEVARLWGEMSGRARRSGVQIAVIDGLIAATASAHGMIVATRNVRDFAPTHVKTLDPWEHPTC